MLVFVDFAGKGEFERPDFYILTVEDWIDFVKQEIANHPKARIEMDERNVPVWLNQVRNGQPYRGMGITPDKIQMHKEKWEKITRAVVKMA